ncbi:hypothetical protein Tco_1535788, partial [Tanacetum coccineum]
IVVMSDSKDSTVTYTEAPPSPDYVPGPEELEQAPPPPVYVPYVLEPVYPKFMPPKDEVLPAEEQPLLAVVSPTADSPRYISESDPEEDPKEETMTTMMMSHPVMTRMMMMMLRMRRRRSVTFHIFRSFPDSVIFII